LCPPPSFTGLAPLFSCFLENHEGNLVLDFRFEEAWLYQNRDNLSRRYGVGTFVAVYDGAVIDWGADAQEVRERAQKAVGEPVFVGPISGDPVPDFHDLNEYTLLRAEYEHYRTVIRGRKYRRRFFFVRKTLNACDELDITGTKREMARGYIQIDGIERRFADHDYRLLVERGAIPKETELIAGIVFWKEPGDRDLIDDLPYVDKAASEET
jgi:hypothetical protein